jgi:hypothetical protein
MGSRRRTRHHKPSPQAVTEVDKKNERASGSLDLKTMIEKRVLAKKWERQQAKLENELLEVGSEEAPVNIPASSIDRAEQTSDLDLDDQFASDMGADDLINDQVAEQNLQGSWDGHNLPDANNGLGHFDDTETMDQNHQSVSTATSHPSMSEKERRWWVMNFEELYQHARSKNFGKTGKEGRKSGRIRIIKWLCEKEGITPYVAPSIVPVVEDTPIIARPTLRPTGAISHPEAILRTSDPALQHLIDEAQKQYQRWPATDLLALAMRRSYQLLKDSKGKLPSKSISAMANWLAAWDVLKSPREKNWWLGDGIDLVNKAKAMGYQGPSRKYELILWLRSTPEDSEVEVTAVAEPTPNMILVKRKAEETAQPISKRPAKGSKRPHGWHTLKSSRTTVTPYNQHIRRQGSW